MSGWGGGYVTDITYMAGYYRSQSPSIISLACLLGGVASPLPGPDDAVSYLEAILAVAAVALVASAIPARRAASIDPLSALRAE